MSDDVLSMVLGALVRLEGNLAKVQDGLTFLRADTMARLDRHENHLTSIRDNISVAMGRTDHMRRIADNTREDVRDLGEQRGAMWRKVNRLEEAVRGLPDRAGEGGKA